MNVWVRTGLAVVAAAGLAVGGVTVAQGSEVSDSSVPTIETIEKPAAPENGTCKKSFSSGAGVTRFAWCFGSEGAINQIEHSAGLEHTGVREGFCIASDSTINGVMPGGTSTSIGLRPPTYPSPTKVVHTTTDGVWRIEQTFAQTPATKSITITMKITNTSSTVRTQVNLLRFMDADMSNSASDDQFWASSRSVVAIQPTIGLSLLSARLELMPATTNVEALHYIYTGFTPVLNSNCHNEDSALTPNASGDRSMGVNYGLGNVSPGASKTVQFVYRVTI